MTDHTDTPSERHKAPDVASMVNSWLAAAEALCIHNFKQAKMTLPELKAIEDAAMAGVLDHAMLARLPAGAQRAVTARLASRSLMAYRSGAIGDERALLDHAIFNALTVGHFMAHMGEDRTGILEGLAQWKIIKAGNSLGGSKGARSRVRWEDDLRERYEQYRRRHPEITVGTQIARALLKEIENNRISGLPSAKRVQAVVWRWMKEDKILSPSKSRK